MKDILRQGNKYFCGATGELLHEGLNLSERQLEQLSQLFTTLGICLLNYHDEDSLDNNSDQK